jgi:excisionase family DNA binding protein
MKPNGDESKLKRAPSLAQHSPARVRKLEPLLTVTEAAEILNTSPKTVRRRVAEGELRAIKIGGVLRIDPVDLEDFIRDHRCR